MDSTSQDSGIPDQAGGRDVAEDQISGTTAGRRTVIEFRVVGKPQPAGSKRAVPIRTKAGVIVRDGRVLTRVIDANPNSAEWKQQVSSAARAAVGDAFELLTGPLGLSLEFFSPRPKSHYGTGRRAGVLKQSAPRFPTSKPDLLKLARGVEDALTGVLYRDDSQIVIERLKKQYGTHFCLDVCVYVLP